jgi:hypothetical protein
MTMIRLSRQKNRCLEGKSGKQYYTKDHFIIQDWADYRYAHPARIIDEDIDSYYRGG